jgi:hypothetical protein
MCTSESCVKSEGVNKRISQGAAAKACIEGSKEKYLKEEQDLRLQFLHEKQKKKEMEILERKAIAEIETALEMQLMQQEHNFKFRMFREKTVDSSLHAS